MRRGEGGVKLLEKVKNEILTKCSNAQVMENEPMKGHTSFKIGGPCDLLVMPKTVEEMVHTFEVLRKYQMPYYVFGNGSNVLVSDAGIRGVVVKTDALDRCTFHDGFVDAGSGILLSTLAKKAYENGLTGLEFASGIPGSLGGAVFMNAGAYDGEIRQILVHTVYATPQGEVCTLENEEHDFGYRSSVFQKNGGVVLEVRLKLQAGDKEQILAKMMDLKQRRVSKQPLEYPSAGSAFKRPVGYYAGKLIMDAGLAGKRIGDAMVSEKHCGFIVNVGSASAQDVFSLVQTIQGEVLQQFGVKLEPEIKFIGEGF